MTSKTSAKKILRLYEVFYRENKRFPTYIDLARGAGEYPSLIERRLASLASGKNAPLVDRGKSRHFRYQPSAATRAAWRKEAVNKA